GDDAHRSHRRRRRCRGARSRWPALGAAAARVRAFLGLTAQRISIPCVGAAEAATLSPVKQGLWERLQPRAFIARRAWPLWKPRRSQWLLRSNVVISVAPAGNPQGCRVKLAAEAAPTKPTAVVTAHPRARCSPAPAALAIPRPRTTDWP